MNYKKLLILVVIILLVLTGITYAVIKIKENTTLNSAFSSQVGKTDINTIWVGTFQIAWNEFLEKIPNNKVEFTNGHSELADELNKKTFTKDMLSEKDYYVKVDVTTKELKDTITNDVRSKFNINPSNILDSMNFKKDGNKRYTIYSMLYKNFNFEIPFDKISSKGFGNSSELFQYFGISNTSKETLNNNIDVLFYDDYKNFAVKLNTKENEEVILYKTTGTDSFENIYSSMNTKENNYKGNKKFTKNDELAVPYINVNTVINYDELCNREIKDTTVLKIDSAIQNVQFALNEKGGNLKSEAIINDVIMQSLNEEARYFKFTDTFVLFLKEKDKEKPYMALRVNNTDILVK